MASPYSPLQLEVEMKQRNWRDRFEDLIALESGVDMINMADRAREAKVAHGWRQLAVEDDNYVAIAHADQDILPSIIARNEKAISTGKGITSLAEAIKDTKIAAASISKSYGSWISSLITSGALKGWRSTMANSSEGRYYTFEKTTNDQSDGQCVTDRELSMKFENGVPLSLGSPDWSTIGSLYPELRPAVIKSDDEMSDDRSAQRSYRQLSIKKSTLRQSSWAEEVKNENDTKVTKVLLVNHYTDGTIENKEIIQDPVKVLQEVEEAKTQMEIYSDAMQSEPEEWMLEAQEKHLQQRTEDSISDLD
ncbi:MAG: hypothetical protein Q9164_003432 [Protoblastenia rupestris]